MKISSIYILAMSYLKRKKKAIAFTIPSKTMRYSGINLNNEVKELYTENCKILMKRLKNIQKNRKISHVHGLEEIVFLKWPHYPKPSFGSMKFLLRLQWQFLYK